MRRLLTTCIVLAAIGAPAHAQRIKDLADIRGAEVNHLLGYGLVVGLAGTGDTNKFTPMINTIVSTLREHDQRTQALGLKPKNAAAVMITAVLPAFSQPGHRIDVTVASMGDAKSLVGGVLLAAALKGHDNVEYVFAQGPLSVGGFSLGKGGQGEIKNHPTTARIPGGGLVEQAITVDLSKFKFVDLYLHREDFTTCARMAEVIDKNLGLRVAKALDSRHVRINIPKAYVGRVPEFLAHIERLKVEPDGKAVVIVNERTGTIVIGQDVRVSPVAIAHGNLTVTVRRDNRAVAAGSLTPGKTVIERNADVKITEEDGRLLALTGGTNLVEVVDALNALGASPRDLITILQAIDGAGALLGRLEIN